MDWFRWWHGSANDPKLRLIAHECNMPVACVTGVWAYILECASSNHTRGQIDNFDYEVAAFHLGVDVETPCNAMKRRGMLHETDETLVVCNWAKWQPKREREDNSSERVRKHRELKKQSLTECNTDETPCNAIETKVTPREDKRREDKNINTFVPKAALLSIGVTESVAVDWLQIRKAKKSAVTETAIKGLVRECELAGISVNDALVMCCERGWSGFKSEWILNQAKTKTHNPAVLSI